MSKVDFKINLTSAATLRQPTELVAQGLAAAADLADLEMVGPGKATALSDAAYQGALEYIRANSEIWEVILTGGDPLMLSPRRLAEIMADIADIDHVRIIRLHTRVPVADPARVGPEMIAALKVKGATTWIALHANHARELTDRARAACAGVIDAGIPMVSQTVLL